MTYDGYLASLYVDGELKKVTVGIPPCMPNTGDLFPGKAENPQFPYWFNGVLNDIRTYNEALCDAAVKQLSGI